MRSETWGTGCSGVAGFGCDKAERNLLLLLGAGKGCNATLSRCNSCNIFCVLQVSNMKGRKVTTLNNELVCVPNVEAILEDFEILGEGLVKNVEAHTEKWTI